MISKFIKKLLKMATLVFKDTYTITIPTQEFYKSLLLTNYAEDALLGDPIHYPESFTPNDYKIIKRFWVDNRVDKVSADNIIQILKFFDFLGLLDSSFGNQYVSYRIETLNITEALIVKHLAQVDVHHHMFIDENFFQQPKELWLELGGLYRTYRDSIGIPQSMHITHLAKHDTIVKFPNIKIPRCVNPFDPLVSKSTKPIDITKGSIDWSTVPWFKELDWKHYPNIAMAGDCLVSLLEGRIPLEINVYMLDKYFYLFANTIEQKFPKAIRVDTSFDISFFLGPKRLIINKYDGRCIESIVRGFPASNSRIWYTSNGLFAESCTVYELVGGFTRLTKGIDEKIYENLVERGWTIYGYKILDGPSETHLGFAEDLIHSYIKGLDIKFEKLGRETLFSPLRLYIPVLKFESIQGNYYDIYVSELVFNRLDYLINDIERRVENYRDLKPQKKKEILDRNKKSITIKTNGSPIPQNVKYIEVAFSRVNRYTIMCPYAGKYFD